MSYVRSLCRIRCCTHSIPYRIRYWHTSYMISHTILYLRCRILYCLCCLNPETFSTSYTISYTISHTILTWYNILLPGPVAPPRRPSSNGDEDGRLDDDDLLDYEDQQYSPPSPMPGPMVYYPCARDPLVRFLSDVPDWSALDAAALKNALKGLPVPKAGPAPRGISIQDVIQVNTALTLPPTRKLNSYAISYMI